MGRCGITHAHVVVVDIVGSSALPLEEFAAATSALKAMTAASDVLCSAQASGGVQIDDTGDGLAVAFLQDPKSPVAFGVEFSRLAVIRGSLRLRIGIHFGPVVAVHGTNESRFAGPAFTGAERAMRACRPDQILITKPVANALTAEERSKYRIVRRSIAVSGDGERFEVWELANGRGPFRLPRKATVIVLASLISCLTIGIGSLARSRAHVDAERSADYSARLGITTSSWPRFMGGSSNDGRARQGRRCQGKLRWKRQFEGSILAGAAVGSRGEIYISTVLGQPEWPSGSELYDLDRTNGVPRWKLPIEVCGSTPAIAQDGSIYISSLSGRLIKIGPQGSTSWTSPAFGSTTSSVLPAGRLLVFGSGRGLEAVNAAGSSAWSVPMKGPVTGSPSLGPGGAIYVISQAGLLEAVHSNGVPIWSLPFRGDTSRTTPLAMSSPSVGEDGTIYLATGGGFLSAVNPSGRILWTVALGQTRLGLTAPAIGADGTLYVGSADGRLYAVSPRGRMKWSFRTGGSVSSSPVVGADGTVYVGSTDATFYSLSHEGKELWSLPVDGQIVGTPAIDEDGYIYVGSDSGFVYCIS